MDKDGLGTVIRVEREGEWLKKIAGKRISGDLLVSVKER